MKIEPIKPLMVKYAKKMKPDPENPIVCIVEEWGEMQNGYDFGSDIDVIGKINTIIDYINSKDNQLL